jgi:hypothetical protein
MALGPVMSAGDPQPTVTNVAARSVIVVVCFMYLISKQGRARADIASVMPGISGSNAPESRRGRDKVPRNAPRSAAHGFPVRFANEARFSSHGVLDGYGA